MSINEFLQNEEQQELQSQTLQETQKAELFNDLQTSFGGFGKEMKSAIEEIIKNKSLTKEQQELFLNTRFICAEKEVAGKQRSDFCGISEGLKILQQNPKKRIVITSFLSQEMIIKNKGGEANFLLNHPNISFVRLPFSPQDFMEILLTPTENKTKERIDEKKFLNLLNNKVSKFFHDHKTRMQNHPEINQGKDQLETIEIMLRLDEEEKESELISFENELISFLKLYRPCEKEYKRNVYLREIIELFEKANPQIREAREKNEKETILKRKNEMMEALLDNKYEIIINYEKDQKYILTRNGEQIQFASCNLEYHKDIADEIGEQEKDVMGGGRISIHQGEKLITLYDESTQFGKTPEEYNEIIRTLLQKRFPTYTIIIK